MKLNKKGKLSVLTKMKYGVGDFGMAVVTAMLQFSMLFYYTDVVGVRPGLAGTAMLVGKITWDLVNDTLFGYLEDKTKSRWGKRRPYLIFGALPFALSFWGVFSIPQGLGDVAYFFLIIGSFILFDTFHTLTATAYSAMTAEITEDYNERTSLVLMTKEVSYMANPVDFDTRDGCTLSGAGMGALHPLYEILHFTTASVTSVKTSSPF